MLPPAERLDGIRGSPPPPPPPLPLTQISPIPLALCVHNWSSPQAPLVPDLRAAAAADSAPLCSPSFGTFSSPPLHPSSSHSSSRLCPGSKRSLSSSRAHIHPAPDGEPRLAFVMDTASFIGAAGGKMFLFPMIGVFLYKGLVRAGVIPPTDKVLQFVCMLFSCLPTATTQIFVTQVASGTASAEHLSAFLIPQYEMMLISMTALTASTGTMIATALNAEQAQLLSENLASTTSFRVFPILVETALYGATFVLAITLVMYGLSTWDWAIDVYLLWDDLNVFLPADLIHPSPDHSKRLKINTALRISQAITNNISVMLSDTVVCWRVYILYERSKGVLWTALALLSALFSALFLCNLTQIGIGFPAVRSLHRLAPGELVIDIIALALCALINMWATSMIGYRAWRCRQEIRRYLKGTDGRVLAESILTLFAESGVVYTALWIVKNTIILPTVENTAYTYYATVVMYQMTGMYPTLIIVLVALKNSHLEHQFTELAEGAINSGKISPGGNDLVFAS
ncbi:hypothetical protein B0H17DRAFT_1212876 [Mycena rosella]|uniref:Uncharacterized protein n=1 Tax=Mycena rosella TaxID=1033263 RepID=A0AAD7CR95_MYCRO|nr:hypothetical protein B0H17DRAFT_1212876 [Mycena rosella]